MRQIVQSLRFSESSASVLLDAIRGVAAALVLLSHWRLAFFVDFTQVQSHRALLYPLYILSGAGHQAVVLFFVLSGYFIGGSVLRSFRRTDWSWAQYSAHRLVRLWIVLLPALILGACWDHMGIYLHQAPALYSGVTIPDMTPDVRHALSLRVLAGNAAFAQTILVPPYGSNGPLWSLANEFWYYALFPLGVCIVVRFSKAPVQTVACSTALCIIVGCLTNYILLAFPVWLLGALLHAVPRRPTAPWQRVIAATVYAFVFFFISTLDFTGNVDRTVCADWILGVATFGLIWVLLGAVQEARQTVANKLSRAAAQFSYTLYVAHTPILIFAVAMVAHDTRWIPGAKTGVLALAVLVLVVAYSWFLATVTEFRTEPVRAWAEGKVLDWQTRLSRLLR
jgi:peptidoglycan/LPS O-acetylase OafA/YrhL